MDVHARARTTTHVLREVAAKIMQHHTQIELSSIVREGTCVAAISVSAVIEIIVFD